MRQVSAGYSCRIRLFALCIIIALLILLSPGARAQETEKTVRVGWFESSFNHTDQYGRRSGYAYEYQQKLAAYSGWRYEYISGSWPTLMQMLIDGEIDLMSDVSYTPERESQMLFPSLPMGTEEYYLFVAVDNRDITPEDVLSLNGRRVGVNKGSIQKDYYRDWARQNGVEAELVEVTGTEAESLSLLESGEIDAYVTVDSFAGPERAVPVFKIGSSDFYFAVRKDRPDLLTELNRAMSHIQDENRYYNSRLFEKYFKSAGANAFLASDEVEWLKAHGAVRVGYVDNYLAFCARDPATGELTGALKDFLAAASDCMVNGSIDFQATAYPNAQAAQAALQAGEVDCIFPSSMSSYDGEKLDMLMTPPLMRTDIYAVVRLTDQGFFSNKEHVVVAVNEGNTNYDAFLQDYFPDWRKVFYPTIADCLKAVDDHVADCVLVSHYRYNNISRLCEKYHLTTLSTGIGLDFSFAVGAGNVQLYSLLSKACNHVPDSTINAALSYYITQDARLTLMDYLEDHLAVVLIVLAVIMLVFFMVMMRSMRAERRAKQLISATETDDMTGLYNRKYFFQYANTMYHAHPEQPMDAIVLNIEQFHSVNALNGREFGDQVLCALGSEIHDVAIELRGIAGRFEADRFDIYCRHTDHYQVIFNRLQGKLNAISPNTSLRLRMGVMPWQANVAPEQLFDRARTACSMARGHYKEHLIVFDESIGKREMYEQRLLNDLRRALDEYEFDVYYQPKYDIQCDPPKLVSAEALIRWSHPELGMIPPDDFIPLFERNGRIGDVDKYVWYQAGRQIARWREEYGRTIPVSVNLSRVDVFDPSLEQTLDGILSYYRLDHDDFKLEVTESAYTENAEQVIQIVESLRQKGYQVEMDDFGTGYSSLNMLSAMPIDVLKMDRAFIRNIEQDERDIQLVALIIGIAQNLKIPVIAEGVETEKQVQLLRDLGCALVQGYYFSRPLHPADFEALFLKNA